MNFQEKVFESTAELRALAAKRIEGLKDSLALLKAAGDDLNQVARRHVGRFVKENRRIALAAGKDLEAFARDTYANFRHQPVAQARKPRKTAARKRAVTAKVA
jgi:hypothetical protein